MNRHIRRSAVCSLLIFLLAIVPFGNDLRAKPLEQTGATLTITPSSPVQVQVGDTIVVEGVLTGVAAPTTGIFTLGINVAPGVPQDADQPIFEPAQPESVDLLPTQKASFVMTAVRPGKVTFRMSAGGDAGVVLEDGTAFTSTFSANAQSAEVTVVAGPTDPVQIPEPLTITLFSVGATGLAAYTRRRRKQNMDTMAGD